MLEIKNVSVGFLQKDLFKNVSFKFFPKERYGLVGANGCGKSTLMKIIASEQEADDGEIIIEQKCKLFRIGQDFFIKDDEKIIDVVMSGQEEAFLALKNKERLLLDSNAHDEELFLLEDKIASLQAYRLKSLAQEILEGLGIKTNLHEQAIKTLSGGYKWRVFLAKVLIHNPDILLLDEPTNYLDIVSIDWLEKFLLNYQGVLLLVSHDRRFMNNIATCIIDIDFCTMTSYKGNYNQFERAKKAALELKEKEIAAQEKDIERKQEFIDRFKAKASKARQAQSRVKQLEKITIIKSVRSSRIAPKFSFLIENKSSKEVLEVKNLNKNYQEKEVIKNVSFFVKEKEKIAIIGANGTGKSTLLKALANEFAECQKSIKWGIQTKIGYFAQDCGVMIKKSDKTVLEWLWQFCADKPQSFPQSFLGKMLFSKDDVEKDVTSLSGGELSRLYFAYLMMLKPNVLLLDEPTNHLDVESIESLTKALCDYDGTLIVVSHDRDFIANIANRIIEVKPCSLQDYLGCYDDFVAHTQKDYLELKDNKVTNNKVVNKNNSYEQQKQKKSLLQKLQKELSLIMQNIENYEEQINIIDEKFLSINDYLQCQKLQEEKQNLQTKIEESMKKWQEIEESIKEAQSDNI